jgi:hypothetical protein
MKISKKRLQEIVLEEMKGLQEADPLSGPTLTPGSSGEKNLTKGLGDIKKDVHNKQAAIAGAKERRKSGSKEVSDASGMSPTEGSIESMLQHVHNAIKEKGEVKNAIKVKQHLQRALQSIQKGEQ